MWLSALLHLPTVGMSSALVSSNPPELLLLSGRELEKDVEKGLLEDLSPYLEGSIALDREDFLENALEGYTVGGKLAGIPVEFILYAVGGRASQVGGLTNWSMEDVYDLLQQYPEMTKLLGDGSTRKINTKEHIERNILVRCEILRYNKIEHISQFFEKRGLLEKESLKKKKRFQ